MSSATTQIVISGKDQLSSVVANAGRRMGTELQAMQRNVLSLQDAFVALAGAAAIDQVRRQYSAYDAALRDMGKVTDESMGQIAAMIGAIPAELGNSTELIQGYYQVISAGITEPTKAMDTLTSSVEAAKAAHLAQKEVIKGTTKVMAAYAGDVKSAAEAADLLFTIEKQGQTSFAELVPIIGDVATVSKELGVSQGEMGAGLAAVTLTAGSTSQAATQYRAAVVGLMKPTKDMAAALESMGVRSGKTAIETYGLAGTLERLQEYSKRSGVQIGKLFESSEALLAVAAMSRNEFAQYNINLKAMEDRAGAADRAFARWKESSQAVDDLLHNTMTNTLIKIGGEVMPTLEAGARATASAIKFVGDNAHDAIGVTAVISMGLLSSSLIKTGTSVAAWASQMVAEQNRAVASTIRLHQAVVAEAQAEVIATERRLAAIPVMFRSVAAEQAVTTAKQRLAVAQAALGATQEKSTIVARGLSAVVGAMGGPIGAITTLLTAGATAWMIWGDNAENAANMAKNAADEAEQAIRRMRNSQAFGDDALAPFRQDIAQAESMLAEARKPKTGRTMSAMGEEEYTYVDDGAIRAAETKVSAAYARLHEAARINRKKLEASGTDLVAVVTSPAMAITDLSKEAEAALSKVNDEIAKLSMTDTEYSKFKISEEYAKLAKELGAASPALQEWLMLKERELKLSQAAKLEPYQITQLEQMNRGDMFYGKADADKRGQAMLDDVYQHNGQLITEFSEKFRALTLGDTEFQIAQLEEQAREYHRAGVGEVALAQWVTDEKMRISREWLDGMKRSLEDYATTATNAAASTESFVTDTMGAFKAGLKQGIQDWNSWGDAAIGVLDNVGNKLLDMALDQATGAMAQSLLGMFTGTGSTASVMPSGGAGLYYSRGHHGGGIVGSGEESFIRPVPAAAFANAPRFHNGFMPGEYPAILKEDEGVFTPGQMRALGSGGNVSIVIHNNTPNSKADAKVKNDGNGGKTIEVYVDEVTSKNLSRFGSASEKSLRNAYNIRPALTSRG